MRPFSGIPDFCAPQGSQAGDYTVVSLCLSQKLRNKSLYLSMRFCYDPICSITKFLTYSGF